MGVRPALAASPSVTATELGISTLSLASALVSRLSTYVVIIILARVLTPEDFGAYSIAMVGVTIMIALVSGGGDMWLNRFTRAHGAHLALRRVWSHYLALALLVAVVLGGVGLLLTPAVEAFTGYGWLAAASVGLGAVAGLSEALLAILRSSQRLFTFFVVRDLATPLAVIALLLLVRPQTAASAQAVAIVVWLAAGLAVAALLAIREGRGLRPGLPAHRARLPLVGHSLHLMYGNLGSRLSAAVDVLVISWFIGLAEVGEYRVAGQFAAGFMVVQHFLFLGLPWQLRRLGEPGSPGSGMAAVAFRQRMLAVLSTVALLVLLAAGEYVLSLLGERFTAAAPLLRVFVLVRYAEVLWGPQHEILVSNALVASDAHSNLVALVAWPAAFFIGLAVLPPVQAALVASALASVARQAYRHRILHKHRLPPVTGHPLGIWPALAVAVAALVAAAGA